MFECPTTCVYVMQKQDYLVQCATISKEIELELALEKELAQH